jgi:hypothetical protein
LPKYFAAGLKEAGVPGFFCCLALNGAFCTEHAEIILLVFPQNISIFKGCLANEFLLRTMLSVKTGGLNTKRRSTEAASRRESPAANSLPKD